jgi:molecular chaperone GrpE
MSEMTPNPETEATENKEQEEAVSETEKLRKDLAEQNDKYLRLFADFDNYKKRMARERLEWIQSAGKDVIIPLLEVMDDCDRAEKRIIAELGEIKSEREGIMLVFTKLRNTLAQKGLKPMQCLHEIFDVEKHNAITEIEVSEELKGKVIDELEKGYLLNDKIIRFAKVVVGK